MFVKFMFDRKMLFEADGTPQGGSSQTQGQGSNSPAQGQGSNTGGNTPSQGQGSDANDSEVALARLIARHNNDAVAALATLHQDNFTLRESRRKLQEQIDQSLLLPANERQTWEAYRALGSPDEVRVKLRQADVERIALRVKFTPQVLVDLDRMAGGNLQYEVRAEQVNGVPVENVYVKDSTDQTAQPILLQDFAAQRWAAYLPALQVNGASQGQAPAPTGVRFPPLSPGGNGQGGSTGKTLVDDFLKEQEDRAKAVKNPLLTR